MDLSIFTVADRKDDAQDPYYEALESYNDLADEVVLINDKWAYNFDWKFIGQQFQKGYEACKGDWVIHADIDYIFHEKDIDKIRTSLKLCDAPAASMWKYQFILVDRYHLKSRCIIAINKKKYGDRIKFNGGGDLCQPTLDGKLLSSENIPEVRVPFYNYDFCFKEFGVIEKDWGRFKNAWEKEFNSGYPDFKRMMVDRYNQREWAKIKIEDHPKYIQDKIKNIRSNQSGYNLFCWVKDRAYDK